MTSRPIYIAIEGVIGVGKTTLAQLLQPQLQPEIDAALVLEAFDNNPFLASFYQEPERYAFQAQVVFLLSRYHQQRRVAELAGRHSLISDYLFAKDRLFARLNLHGDEWETYQMLHDTLAERIIVPDLVLYLRGSVDTLMSRILQRGRPYERAMSREYIHRLSQAYDAFFAGYDATPYLALDTDELQLPSSAEDQEWVGAAVRTTLDAVMGAANPSQSTVGRTVHP